MTHKLTNPIIPGYYPDPSIIRVGDDFYLACSSFEMFPGIPVFHSKDLEHWTKICNAMNMDNGFHMEKNCMSGGLMAPTLRYNDGTYYIMNANFADKGNYLITATNPAGPWSEPHWLDDIPGIDASLFFDNDGQCYVMGTGDVWDNGTGKMERGIWLAKYDIKNFKLMGEPFCIFNNALRVSTSPEAPHIYHVGDYYYLIIAEGGTEHYHSVAVARSKELFSFFEGNPANPVMTHRHMGFKCPIGNIGHADLVDTPDGNWYAVMLGSRLIDGKSKNMGRETFICPVVWEREWPLFSPETGKIEWEYDADTSLPWEEKDSNIACRDEFDEKEIGLDWVTLGTPYGKIYTIEDSKMKLNCLKQRLDEELRPMSMDGVLKKDYYMAFMGKRQVSINEEFSCKMTFMPKADESAGIACVQAVNHQLHIRRVEVEGVQKLQVYKTTSEFNTPPYFPGFTSVTNREVVKEIDYDKSDVVLRIKMEGNKYTIFYGETEETLSELMVFDAFEINPEKVGCMVGTLVGMFATGNGIDSDNTADFDWFEVK